MEKFLSIPVEKFTLEAVENDDRIAKLSMKFMHDGENLNRSFIGLDVINIALNDSLTSVTGIPVLASFEEDGSDFKEHNEDEISIGFVPQVNNNLNFEKEKENDKTYVYVDGYIWRHYSKNAIDILEKAKDNSKACSIEIEILDGYQDKKRKLYIITSFKFLGITLLGKKYQPGMEGANVTLEYALKSSEEYANKLKEFSNELQMYFTKNQNTQNNKNINTENISDGIDNKIVKEDDLMSFNKNEFALKFGLTANQMFDELYKATRNAEQYTDDYWGGTYCRYSMRDFDDQFVYCSDYKESKMVRCPYEMNGDNPELHFDNCERVKTAYVLWEDGTDDDDVEDQFILKEKELIKKNMSLENDIQIKDNDISKITSEKEEITTKYSNLENTIADKDIEITRLKKFELETKQNETQVKADELFTKYSEYITVDEKTELNKKLFSYEKFEDFEDKVKAIVLPKVEAKMFALIKQNPTNSENNIDISLMGLLPIDDIKNNKNKSSIELLEDFVQNN